VAKTDAAGGFDESPRLGDAGCDPVVDADELEKILGSPQHDCEDCHREARCRVVWGLAVTGMGEGELMPIETHGTGDPFLISFIDVCLDYHRECGARAQLAQDTRV
jgi:hypothetical protein